MRRFAVGIALAVLLAGCDNYDRALQTYKNEVELYDRALKKHNEELDRITEETRGKPDEEHKKLVKERLDPWKDALVKREKKLDAALKRLQAYDD